MVSVAIFVFPSEYCTTLEGDECSNCWSAYLELKDLEVHIRDLQSALIVCQLLTVVFAERMVKRRLGEIPVAVQWNKDTDRLFAWHHGDGEEDERKRNAPTKCSRTRESTPE